MQTESTIKPSTQAAIHQAPKKSWYRSKTLWFNAVVAALMAAQLSGNLLQALMPQNTYAIGMVMLTIINAILRIITTQGIGK